MIYTLKRDDMPFLSHLNHTVGVYIINFVEIAYHQHEVLYIIIAKAIQPAVDDIRLR